MLAASCLIPATELELERFERTQPHMGSLARIVIYAPDSVAAEKAMSAAFNRIQALNDILSDYLPDSELSYLSQQAGGRPVAVSPELFRILFQARALSERSSGAFDVTAGAVIRLWRRARRQRELPAPERMTKALEASGHRHLKLNGKARTVQLTKPGMLLDVGGIAKGYAADEALKSLQQFGISKALVALGGDIALGQPPPGKQAWTIDVATEGFPDLRKLPPLQLREAGVSTSGDAEQHVEIGGRRYSHIIDPRTGQALTGRSSVTVVARTATESDSLATAISVMGHKRGLKLADSTPGAAALMILQTDEGVKLFKSKRWNQ